MKKKSVETRALEKACRYLVFVTGELCDKCPADKGGEIRGCNGANRLCQTEVRRHFLSLAKKEMDKEKKS